METKLQSLSTLTLAMGEWIADHFNKGKLSLQYILDRKACLYMAPKKISAHASN
jgi:hypothetical protein